MRRTVFFIVAALGCVELGFAQPGSGAMGRGSDLAAAKEGGLDGAEVSAFVGRVTGGRGSAFVAEYVAPSKGKDVFELESRKGKIILRGSNGLSVGSALNYYLREYCHSLVTGNGVDLRLPAVLPVVKGKIRRETPYQIGRAHV